MKRRGETGGAGVGDIATMAMGMRRKRTSCCSSGVGWIDSAGSTGGSTGVMT